MHRLSLLVIPALALSACAERPVAGPAHGVAGFESAQLDARAAVAAGDLTVASVNMYFGAPVDQIIDAPAEEVPAAVAEAWAILIQTDFPARARASAAQLAKHRPHLIGLQEAALLRTEPVFDPSTPAETEFLDFLTILVDELADVGAYYEVAVSQTTTDIELPKLEGVTPGGQPILSGVRLTDRDVILVRSDVAWSNAMSSLYSVFLGPSYDPTIPIAIDVLRGWTAVTATVSGIDVRFANTHLESEDRGPLHQIRTGQAFELTQVMMGETLPLIVVGDFNSGPGRPLGEGEYPAYDLMLDAGYTDVWTHPSAPSARGNSCCHADDLSNTRPQFAQRIDLIFAKNLAGLMQPSGKTIWQSQLLNDQVGDLKKYGVWSSDHAAIVSRLVLPNPQVAMP
jgi:hypothetical protein